MLKGPGHAMRVAVGATATTPWLPGLATLSQTFREMSRKTPCHSQFALRDAHGLVRILTRPAGITDSNAAPALQLLGKSLRGTSLERLKSQTPSCKRTWPTATLVAVFLCRALRVMANG